MNNQYDQTLTAVLTSLALAVTVDLTFYMALKSYFENKELEERDNSVHVRYLPIGPTKFILFILTTLFFTICLVFKLFDIFPLSIAVEIVLLVLFIASSYREYRKKLSKAINARNGVRPDGE